MSPWRWVVWVVLALGAFAVVTAIITVSMANAAPKGRAMFIPLHRGDIDLLARTLYGEARGEGIEGMQAIAWVVVNRVRRGAPRFAETLAGVVKAPHQFSCWSKSDPNAKLCSSVTEADPIFALAVFAASSVLSGQVRDMVGGADHYHATWLKPYPHWAASMKVTAKIGQHVFYKDG
jgi:N-acetylmuramoyl-L-alanine amidase